MTEPLSVVIGTEECLVTVEPLAPGEQCVTLQGRDSPAEAVLLSSGPTCVVSVDGRVFTLLPLGDGRFYDTRTRSTVIVERGRRQKPAGSAPAASGTVELRAPMPGRIVRVLASEGAEVAQGAGLVVIEAMKMENELLAPRSGTVRRVAVRAGDAVERDALLLEIG